VTFDYAKSVRTAAGLIAKFGAVAVLRKASFTGPDYDPTPGHPVYVPVMAVDVGRKDRARNGVTETMREIIISTEGVAEVPDGTLLAPERGDRILMAAAEVSVYDSEVYLSGAILDDGAFVGRSHEIAEVRPLAPAGVVVMWEASLVI
jgi:hypothetical protein